MHRNQAFEFVASVLPPFLAYAGRHAEITFSDYDDSLALELEGSADVEFVWFDLGHYRERLDPAALAAWIGTRLAELRRRSAAPIVVADDPRQDGPARRSTLHCGASRPRYPACEFFLSPRSSR